MSEDAKQEGDLPEVRSPTIVGNDEWIAARLELLEEEKQVSKAIAALAAKRAALPWREVSEDYALVGAGGATSLSALFGDQSQLIVYHLMMGPGITEGCSLCSFFIDQFMGGLPHLRPRAAFAVIAKTEYSNLGAFASSKQGWDASVFFSSSGSSLNEDLQVSFTAEQVASGTDTYNYNRLWGYGSEAPGVSVFRKDGDKMYHTYSTFAAGLGGLSPVMNLLDLTPDGRQEKDKRNMWWVKHKEEY